MGGFSLRNEYEIRGDVTAIFLKRRSGEILETLISTSDLPKVQELQIGWYARLHRHTKTFYVQGHTPRIGEKDSKTISLHRFIMDNPKGLVVDHINHDTLNNTRKNLRAVTKEHNCQNLKGAQRNSKTGIRGVSWNKRRNRWYAQIRSHGKNIYVGLFKNIEDAEKAVIEARRKYMPGSREFFENENKR